MLAEVNLETKRKKVRKMKHQSSEENRKLKCGNWTEEEHARFLKGLELFGNSWKNVEEYIETRTCAQIRSHAQKHFRRIRANAIAEIKKSGKLNDTVFVVIREYRNNTYSQNNSHTLAGTNSTSEESPGQNLKNVENIDLNQLIQIKEEHFEESQDKFIEFENKKIQDEEMKMVLNDELACQDDNHDSNFEILGLHKGSSEEQLDDKNQLSVELKKEEEEDYNILTKVKYES